MILLQVIGDSATNTSKIIAEGVYTSHEEMIGALLMPFILLVLFSAIKNLVAVGVDSIDSTDFFAEMAIDLLSIFSSFIIGRFLLESNSPNELLKAFKIIGLMSVCVIGLCYIRRRILKMRDRSEFNGKIVSILIVGEFFVDLVCLFLIVMFL